MEAIIIELAAEIGREPDQLRVLLGNPADDEAFVSHLRGLLDAVRVGVPVEQGAPAVIHLEQLLQSDDEDETDDEEDEDPWEAGHEYPDIADPGLNVADPEPMDQNLDDDGAPRQLDDFPEEEFVAYVFNYVQENFEELLNGEGQFLVMMLENLQRYYEGLNDDFEFDVAHRLP